MSCSTARIGTQARQLTFVFNWQAVYGAHAVSERVRSSSEDLSSRSERLHSCARRHSQWCANTLEAAQRTKLTHSAALVRTERKIFPLRFNSVRSIPCWCSSGLWLIAVSAAKISHEIEIFQVAPKLEWLSSKHRGIVRLQGYLRDLAAMPRLQQAMALNEDLQVSGHLPPCDANSDTLDVT